MSSDTPPRTRTRSIPAPSTNLPARALASIVAAHGGTLTLNTDDVLLHAEREHEGLYEMGVKVAESPERFAFILQRVGFGKLTPHEARQKAERERDDILQTVAEWCTESANTDAEIHLHDAAAGLMLRLASAGHTLPEVMAP